MKLAFFNAQLPTGKGGLLIEGETIVAVGKDVTAANVSGAEVYDCQGRMISCLEGGYVLNPLARSVAAHVKVLIGAVETHA